MYKTLFALSLGFGGLVLLAPPTHAQAPNCAQRHQVVERLTSRFGEIRQSIGIARNSGVVEVYASTETGTWTIVVTLPNGMSCLVASGQSYEKTLPQTPVIEEDV